MRRAEAGIDPALRVEDFAFELPEALIAQTPLDRRDASRMLVVERAGGAVHHSGIADLPAWLRPGDLLVANNSRVFPGRLKATKTGTGGRVELLLLRPDGAGRWEALARPTRRLRPGTRLEVASRNPVGLPAVVVDVVEVGDEGRVLVTVEDGSAERLAAYGETPLPPYIREPLAMGERYQTVYGTAVGSAAAPTAGLHLSEDLLERLRRAGVGWAEVTLHIGLDTFRPVTAERVAEHRIHREWCEVPEGTARAVAATRRRGDRVVAVGTTAARTLETLGERWDEAAPAGFSGMTELFVVPGYRWRIVDALLTNFHLPRSTLLMMVSSFGGVEAIRRAYEEAIAARYRFYSFGDAMLIA